MRYDSEHKERTRRKVLSEAAAAIREHGPERISVADLMAKAGLTHGGFYAHFKSKDELVAHAISQMFEERQEFLKSCVEGREPTAGIEKYIDHYLSMRHRADIPRGCPMPSMSGDLARLPLQARKRFAEGVEGLTQAVATVLRELKKPDPEELASSMLAEMSGALALS